MKIALRVFDHPRNGLGLESAGSGSPLRLFPSFLATVSAVALMGVGPVPSPLGAEAPDTPTGGRPVHLLIAYHSRSGQTRQMAVAVGEGAKRLPGTITVTKAVEEVSQGDLEAADAIALGCPTYFANIPGKMKVAIDDWNWKWKVDFTDKVGGAFATGGGQVGGKEHVVVSLLLFMINNRMVVAGPLYEDAEGEDRWGESGAAAMTGPLDPGVGEAELESGRRLGERLARLAAKLNSRR